MKTNQKAEHSSYIKRYQSLIKKDKGITLSYEQATKGLEELVEIVRLIYYEPP